MKPQIVRSAAASKSVVSAAFTRFTSTLSSLKSPSIICLLAALGACLLSTPSYAALAPATASGIGIDDWNTSTLNPNTVIAGNNTPNIFTGQCPWLTTAMNAFCTTYTASYQWAAAFANEASDLKVTDYAAWVVNPDANSPVNGFNLQSRPSGDKGGATFGLTYTPKAGDPTKVLFIQAYQEILYGLNGNPNPVTNVKLDNGGIGLPQYGGASSYAAGASKMADRPFDSETDTAMFPEGYHTDVQFQTVVAVDNGKDANGDENYTLYQYAEWWGYQYSNSEVPEPVTILAGALPLVLLIKAGFRRCRAQSAS
jgi:hypothetical protein